MKNNISKELIQIFKSNFRFKSLNLHEPDLNVDEVKFLKKCIFTNEVSAAGKFVSKFENEISKLTKSKHVIATNSGTSALHIACILAGLKEQEEVIIPSFTFVAAANAVMYCSAIPHFVDIEEQSFGIDPEKLRRYLSEITIVKKGICINKLSGRKIRAIIPVHIFGHPIKIEEIIDVASEFNLLVIEDAAEAIGSYYKSTHVGKFGNIGILSFNGNKTITCGAGGAILTEDKLLADQARHLISTAKKSNSYNYIHDRLGFNYRMPNINAAIGYSQIKRIKKILKNKRKLFFLYSKIFRKQQYFKLLSEPTHCRSNYWLQTILIDKKFSHLTTQIINDLNKVNIHIRPGWELMTNLKYFNACPRMETSIAKEVSKRIINIPSSSFLINQIKNS